jgi:plastocyanin
MLGRRMLFVVPATVLAVAGVAVGSAVAASGGAPKVDKIKVVGGTKAKPGFYIQDMLRFTPYKSTVKAGGTIQITTAKSGATEGPHTFSLVKKSQLPLTAKAINNCKVCGQIAQAHGADPNSEAPPATPLVDGGDGFNKPGDSAFFDPSAPLKLKVTAKKGTTLYYMCALHPWMQGSVVVK